MDAPFPPQQLRRLARWCRNAAWVIAGVGLAATLLDAAVAVGQYQDTSAANDSSAALLFPLSSLASTLLALAGTIFYAVLLFAISGMLDHYALTQVNSIEATGRHGPPPGD